MSFGALEQTCHDAGVLCMQVKANLQMTQYYIIKNIYVSHIHVHMHTHVDTHIHSDRYRERQRERGKDGQIGRQRGAAPSKPVPQLAGC